MDEFDTDEEGDEILRPEIMEQLDETEIEEVKGRDSTLTTDFFYY